MPQVGIRELKSRTGEILRAVREDKVQYLITYRGRPAARLIPVEESGEDVWTELERLRDEISAKWKSEKSAAELVSEGRRQPIPGNPR